MPKPIATTNPATNEVQATFEAFTDEQLEAAIAATHTAFSHWRRVPATERAATVGRAAALMRERSETFAQLITTEMGKLIAESRHEVELSASILDHYATHGPAMLADVDIEVETGTATVQTRPLGVLLGVMPWNFPLYQVVRFAGPNLVAGNTLLLKHASNCPQTAIALEQLFVDAGLPEGGYTNLLVPGSACSAIAADPRVKGVSLTGSEAAGASLAKAAGENLTKSVLELGGSDPMLVLDGEDLQRTVAAAMAGRLANNGQSCIAAKRIIVLDGVYDAFVASLASAMDELKLGDPADEDTTAGPMVDEASAQAIAEQIQDALDKGATAVVGGTRADRPGAYLQPTLLTGANETMRIFTEELFGPVAVVYSVPDEASAVTLANATDFGLGATVFTHDPAQATRVAEELQVGMVWVNHPTATAPELPFGGVGRSGYGRELSTLGMAEFVNKKLLRIVPADSPLAAVAG